MLFKRGQVTIFIILGILILGTVVLFLTFKSSEIKIQLPISLEPVYISFLSCLEDDTLNGVNVLKSQGGYIYMPDFEPGSSYMPFSSQLDFLGNPIPYWYYVSGNNIPKEQVPTIGFMQDELDKFIEQKIRNCVFDSYYSQGFEIDQGVPKSSVNIRDGKILVNLDMPINITKANESFLIKSHSIEVPSNLKKLYDSAVELYSKEQKEMFLENYTVDILRNYAPVDGVEITCSPLTWNAEKVFAELQTAIEANIFALKTKGGDFTLTKPENKYFVIDTEINARFINSKNWSNSFEVNPSRGALLISEPMGNQQGLGILGFCYVPYHFVYNIKYPVLIQVYEGQEFFQFPFAVVIQGNLPRKAMTGDFFDQGETPDLCEYKNTLTTVYITDKRANPIGANISYGCSSASCEIGGTKNGTLKNLFPQCVNGNLIVSSSGFKDRNVQYTVLEEGEVSVYLDKLYEKNVNLKLDSRNYSGRAIISFVSGDKIDTIIYPEQKKISLAEGQYQIQVSTYENSSLAIPASNQSQCIDVPKTGLGSIFGLTEQKCFDYQIPAQIVSNALSGGGKEDYFILEYELENSKSIEINAYGLPKPNSIEQLQTNYVLFENKGLDVFFK
ncbi:MAG: hypothetical protein ABIH28_01715 [archaeon]